MKVIISKENHPQYIGMSSTGQFVKFRHKTPLQIGEMTDIKPSTLNIAPRLVAGVAAAIFLTTTSIFGYAYSVPVDYLYVDINPSIELAVNCFDRVIGAKGLNADGEAVIAETSLNYTSTEKSVEKIIEKSIEKGYMAENLENVVLLNTSGDEKVLKRIKEKVGNYTSSGTLKNINPEVQVDSVDKAQVQEAQKQHISAGRLKLIEKAVLNNPELSKEQMTNMPVRDIIKQTKKDKVKEIIKDIKDNKEIDKKEVTKKSDNPPAEYTVPNKVNPRAIIKQDIQNDTKVIAPKIDRPNTPRVEDRQTPQSKPDRRINRFKNVEKKD